MFDVVRVVVEIVFVFFIIGGGIKDIIDLDGIFYFVFEVVGVYFCLGVDKVFIGSEVVIVVEEMFECEVWGEFVLVGKIGIEIIFKGYGW